MSLDQTNEVAETNNEPNAQEISQRVIEVENPSTEEMRGIVDSITVNYNYQVDTKPTEFKFKKSTDKDTCIETIRKPVVLAIPYPSVEGVVAILNAGGKQLELLMEAVQGVVNAAVRDLLYDDVKLNAANFPVDKISWEAIANIPKVQRRGGGIPKEVWEAFGNDYCEVMPTVTGKSLDAVANAAKILIGKLQAARTNEPVLTLLMEQLAIYAEHSPNIGEFVECVEFLTTKAETFLNVSEEELLANL